MTSPIRKSHPILSFINHLLIDIPSPSNISYMWNFGSLLGMCLILQVMTGILLSMHYSPDILTAFNNMSHISRDVNHGWLLRSIHSNGASLFFILLYLHIGRGIYYSSFTLHMTWNIGIIILLISMATAFLGYVLPWGQMSFWGATVITNLLSAIPYLGETIVYWLWGGFSVNNATLNRFFALHFLLPFIMMLFIMIHLIFLHETGSTNPTGTSTNPEKIPFHPFFSLKDILGMSISLLLFLIFILFFPSILIDPENYIMANPMVTPIHIQPEWYFLFAYAILRSIPNKMGGVLALLTSILILFLPPILLSKHSPTNFNPFFKVMFWFFSSAFLILTWLGSKPVENPYILLSQMFSLIYFSFFLIFPMLHFSWNKIFYS